MLTRKSLTLVLLTICAVSSAWADSQARIVRLSYLEGNVQLDRGDGNGYIRAFLNMPLVEGASLWCKEDARVEIEFEDGSTIRMVPDTILHFRELRLRSDGSKSSAIDLRNGTAYFDIKKHKEDDFRIFPGDREFALEKSSQFRVTHDISRDPGELNVAVFKGELNYENNDGRFVSIRKNETLEIDFSDTGRYYLARGISNSPHDYWDKERAEDRLILARQYERESLRIAYLGDLYHHGTFFEIHGRGRLWRPFGVSVSWNPFDHGSWVWYPHAGYVWVSGYSWGWTPYRYGSWVHVGNRGWCWQPSLVYTTWVPVPVIINAPRGYVTPRIPHQPRGPIIHVGRGVDTAELRDRPAGRDGRILVQDRVRGIREIDGRDSAQRLTPVVSTGGGTGGRTPRTEDGDRAGRRGGVETDVNGRTRIPGTATNEERRSLGERKRQGELGIDAHKGDDAPVQMDRPADNGREATERKRQGELGIDAHRGDDDVLRSDVPTEATPSTRRQRTETPVRVERRENGELSGEERDRPARTQRMERMERPVEVRPQVREERPPSPQPSYTPPQRTYTPPPSTPPSAAPSSAPTQRMSPPPSSPAPQRSAPARETVRDK